MSTPVRPVVTTPDDQEFQAWKAKQGSPQSAPVITHDDAEFQAWKANQSGDNGAIANPILRGLHKGAETIASGFPGARGLVAMGTGLSDLLSGKGFDESLNDANQSLDRQKRDVASMPGYLRVPLQMIGGAPLAVAAAPLGLIGGGAAFGAAAGADQDTQNDPLSKAGAIERVKNIAKGSAVGAVGAKLGQFGGRVAGNIAARSGLTDALSKGLSNVMPNTSAAIGTAGQVGEALSDRQSILDNLGDAGDTGTNAAQQQIDRVASTRAHAKELYDHARQDQTVINNPRIRQILSDPRVRKAYQAVSNSFDQSGRPLPSTPTNTVLSPRSGASGLLSDDDVSNAAAIFDRMHGGGSGVNPTLPDPETLSLLKRELYASAQGKLGSSVPLKQEEAQAILPLVDELRGQLHSASPAWKLADAFYSSAKGEEGAFADGYDAFRNAKNVTGKTLTENSPEAQRLALDTPRFASEPVPAQQARGTAFRTGASSSARESILDKPVDRGLQSIIGLSELAPTQPAMQARSLMFENPETASPLEQTLAKIRAKAASLPSGSGDGRIPVSPTGLLRAGLRKATQSPNLIKSQEGQQLLADLLRNPQSLADQIAAYRNGAAGLQPLQQLVPLLLGGQGAR